MIISLQKLPPTVTENPSDLPRSDIQYYQQGTSTSQR